MIELHPRSLLAVIAICHLAGCADRQSDAQSSSLTACPGASAQGQPGDMALAKCLAKPVLIASPRAESVPKSVILYVDRSASMRGFLDPDYPARLRTDYRSVIDRVAVGLRPVKGFSFGATMRPIAPTLGTLSDKGFYADRDTKMEEVLSEIAGDTAEAYSHVIVGDGRRGNADVAIRQFVRMREVVEGWLRRGGSFVVATSLAPFKTVETDPSGCRKGQASRTEQTCPLYAFALVRRGDDVAMTATLADAFEHIFVWPMLALPSDQLILDADEPSRSDIRLQRRWSKTEDGAPLARVSGTAPSIKLFSARLTVQDTSAAIGRGYAAALAGQGISAAVRARAFRTDAVNQPWQPVSPKGSIVMPSSDGRRIDFATRGASGQKSIFRVDLEPTGEPSWLSEFDASDAHDVLRTYGLGRLFESFRIAATRANDPATDSMSMRPVARFFVVAN
jgi:hypothetical protein